MQLLEAFGTVIIGMGIVFSVLILISLIIYCFNIFPYLESKKRAKKAAIKDEVKTAQTTKQPPVVTQNGITGAEVAAIVAAIEAYTGMNRSEFVVQRIVRR